MDILIIIMRTTFSYIFLFLIFRLMGKRELGQLSVIDFIVSILIAELVVISIENKDASIMDSLVPIIVLVILQMFFAYITLRNPKIRNLIDGNPSVIIKDGKINYKEMVKEKYNLEDFLMQLRDKGYHSIEQIEYAILETNGTLSIFPVKNHKSPLPLPLILDGEIQQNALTFLKKDKEWVLKILERKNLKLDQIFYGFYKDKNIFLIKSSDFL